MATFRLWPATDGPPASAGDPDNYSLGVEFEVDQVCDFAAWHWWCQQDATVTFGLYEVDSESTGTLLGSVVDVAVVAGGWRRQAATAPVALSPGVRYRAVVFSTTDGFYSSTSAYWLTGDGSAGITNGPLMAPGVAGATGSDQGSVIGSGALAFPTQSFNGTNYWVDAEVETADGSVSHPATGTVEVVTTTAGAATAEHTATGTINTVTGAVGEASQTHTAAGTAAVTTSAAGAPTLTPPGGITDPMAALIALASHCICVTFTDLCECCGHSGTSLPPASDCCECEPGKNGRAYIQVERIFPVGKPSLAKASKPGCGGGRMAVEFAVTIYRCVEMLDGEQHPSCEVTTAEMYRNIEDMALVRQALLCCLRDEADDNAGLQIQILEQSPIDPQGGCGGTLTKAVASADNHILNSGILTIL